MLTLQSLLDEVGLSLAAGREGAESPIRWVHITELLDPTPWMSGGELLLTTGIQLGEEDEQRAFVRRLVDHHLAGLGRFRSVATGTGAAECRDGARRAIIRGGDGRVRLRRPRRRRSID